MYKVREWKEPLIETYEVKVVRNDGHDSSTRI